MYHEHGYHSRGNAARPRGRVYSGMTPHAHNMQNATPNLPFYFFIFLVFATLQRSKCAWNSAPARNDSFVRNIINQQEFDRNAKASCMIFSLTNIPKQLHRYKPTK